MCFRRLTCLARSPATAHALAVSVGPCGSKHTPVHYSGQIEQPDAGKRYLHGGDLLVVLSRRILALGENGEAAND